MSERTFRRWTRRYEEEGEAGLLDRRLGKASGRRVPADRAEEVERLYRERYQGFTVKHFHEHLVKDHGFGWGYTWTKLHLQCERRLPKAPRKGAHRRKRPGWPVRRRPARTVLGACRTAGPQPHAFTDHVDAANCGPASTGFSVDAPASSRSIACSNGYMATSLNFRWCSTGRRYRRTPMAPSATSFSCHQAQGPWRYAQRGGTMAATPSSG